MSNFENRVQKDLYTDATLVEANEDFILPDYMPEIGRILRVTASLFPEEGYPGSDGVDFSGRVIYRLLYSDSEGVVTESPLEGRYHYRTPKGERSEGIAYTEERIESVSTRPTAPRKLNIRTRISARPHFLSDEEVAASPEALLGDTPCEMRFCHPNALTRGVCHAGVLHKEDRFTEEGIYPDELSLISVQNAVLPEAVSAHDGYLSARGRILFTLLLRRGEGTPYVKSFSIPFEEDVAGDDIKEGDAPVLRAFCGEPSVSFEEEGEGTAVLLDCDLSLSAVLYRNRPLSLLEDLYAHGAHHEIQAKPFEGASLVGCQMGNATVSGEVALGEDFRASDCILSHFTVKEVKATASCDRVIFEGTLDASLLSFFAEGSDRHEASLPFRAELTLDAPCEEGDMLTFSVLPVGGSAQQSKTGVRLSTELSLSVCVSRPYFFRLPASAVKVEDITPPNASTVTLYYPTDKDTLWSVGKRYGVPISVLKEQNGIPMDGDTADDSPQSLDGYAYLFVHGL